MQISFYLGNRFHKIYVSSHTRVRTQEVNGDKRRERKKKREKLEEEKKSKKRKIKVLITMKKLIKLVNSPAAAPKT